jgi:hypothetical protein
MFIPTIGPNPERMMAKMQNLVLNSSWYKFITTRTQKKWVINFVDDIVGVIIWLLSYLTTIIVMAAVVIAVVLFAKFIMNGFQKEEVLGEDNVHVIPVARFKTFECDQFSVSYPNGYYAKEEIDDSGSGSLYIGRDSTDEDMTSIIWQSPGTFPSNEHDFVTLFVSKEIEEYKKDGMFYDVMTVDSTFTIDGYPTYSISSIFTEGSDTIIQSRTGLIIPDKLNMMIVQRANTKKPMDEVKAMSEIIQSIKIKE